MAYKSRYMQKKFGEVQPEPESNQEYKSNYMRSRSTTAAAPVTLESLIKRPTSKQQEMQSRVEKLTQRSQTPQSKYQTWADDSYKMSSDEKKSAKQFVSDVDKQLWAARKNGTFDSQMNNPESELAKNFEIATKLKNKTSLGAAFTAGFAKGTGSVGATRLAAKATGNESLKSATESIKKTADTTQSANPIAGGAGYFGGKMAEYAVGRGVMTGLPGIGTTLGKAGAVANTALSGAGKAGAAASKFFTAERLAGLMGDQMLDVALDTLPEAVGNIQGGKSAGDVAGAAAKNFAINALFNVGGEVVPAAAGKVIGKLKGSDSAARRAVDSIPEIKKEKSSIPPTQVNAEASQNAVSDTAFSNPSIADSVQNTTSHMLNESLHAPKINGVFDKKIGTPSNPARQNIVNDYIDYSLEYSKQTKQLGNTGFPKQRISIDFGTADNRLVTDLKKQGVDVSGYHHYLVDNDIRHINNSHGIGTNEKYPVTAEDLKQIPDIVKNYDNVYVVENASGRNGIYYVKRHNGTTYFLEQILDGKNILSNKQMIKVPTGTIPDIAQLKEAIKNRNSSRFPNGTKAQQIYVQDVGGKTVPNSIISNSQQKATPDSKEVSDNILNELYKPTGDIGAKTSQSVDMRIDGDGSTSTYAAPQKSNAAAVSEPVIPKGMKERGYAESIRIKSDVPNEVRQEFIDSPELYKALSNEQTSKVAENIFSQGTEFAINRYHRMLDNQEAAAIPLGKMLADEMISSGNREGAVEILREMSAKLTKSGQFSQAAAITLMKNDPITAAQYITRQMDGLNAAGKDRFKSKWKNFELTDDEVKAFGELPVGDSEGIKALYEQIGNRIAKEYPATLTEKFVEASHIAMLLNPRTLAGRNVLSNAAMLPFRNISDKISALGQQAYSLINPSYKPTQAFFIDKKSKELASQIYQQVKDSIDGGTSKWDNAIKSGMKNKEIFKGGILNPQAGQAATATRGTLNTVSKRLTGDELFNELANDKSVLENLRQLTYGMLELGDKGFVRKNFEDRMASYVAAQGIKSVDDIPPEAIDIATNEALKATFKDDNALTQLFGSIKKIPVAGEVLLPFTKTPANVTMRAWDYTVGGVVDAIKGVKDGAEFSQIIDSLSKSATGIGTVLIGALLYKKGIITGPPSDNKRKAAFEKQQGWLPYAVKVGDKYITFDWAQPAAIPFIIGANVASQVEKDGNLDVSDLAQMSKNVLATYLDTMLKQSTLQNVAGVFSGYGSPGENAITEFAEAPLRLIPAALGATARTLDPVQRQTYTNGNILQTVSDTAKSKIPLLSKSLPPAYDTWGNELKRDNSTGEAAFSQYINPGQTKSATSTPMDGVVTDLYQKTGDESVFPKKASWSVDVNGEDKKLTNKEYSNYQREMGQASYDILESLYPTLKNVDTDNQVYAVNKVYGIADELSKAMLFGDTPNKEAQAILDYAKEYQQKYGKGTIEDSLAAVIAAQAAIYEVTGDKYPNGKTIPGSTQRNKIDALTQAGIDYPEAQYFYNLFK